MKAIRFHEYGGPEVLRLEDVPLPEAGRGEVRVRVAASAFNPLDAGIRGGWVRDAFPVRLPHVPGYDVAGTVDALGADVAGLRVGDPVVGFLSMVADGSAAQYVVAPAEALVAAPASIPLEEAAALPSTAVTAWQVLVDAADLQPGRRLLVNGAGGAVGRFVVQLARRAGAHVIAITSGAGIEAARADGAHEVLDRGAGPLRIDEAVDVLVNLGRTDPESFADLVGRVRDGGVVVNTVPAVEIPDAGDRGVRGVAFFVRPDRGDLERLVRLVDAGELRVAVDARVPLEQLPSVHARSDAGELRGKTVVLPPAD